MILCYRRGTDDSQGWEENDQGWENSWSKLGKRRRNFPSRQEEGRHPSRGINEQRPDIARCTWGDPEGKHWKMSSKVREKEAMWAFTLWLGVRSLFCKQWNHCWVTGEGCKQICILEISSLQYGWLTWGQKKQTREEVIRVIQLRDKRPNQNNGWGNRGGRMPLYC